MCTCVTVIHSEVRKARKVYEDDGWEHIQEWIEGGLYVERGKKIPFAELRLLVAAKNNQPSKIKKGELYERQFNCMDGHTYTWRTKKVFYDFMNKYQLFPEC